MITAYITASPTGLAVTSTSPDREGKTVYQLNLPEGANVALLTDQLNAFKSWASSQTIESLSTIVLKINVGA